MRPEIFGIVPTALTTASTAAVALAAAIDQIVDAGTFATGPAPIIMGAARGSVSDPSSGARLAAANIGARLPLQRVDVVAPPPLGGLLLASNEGWTDVVVSPPAERVQRVLVPRCLASTPLVVAVDLRAGDPRPIDLVARHAHPRQRLASRLSPPSFALAAEIALAFRPSLVLLLAEIDHRPLAVATRDLIAAELVWLALALSLQDDAPGPWEDAVVQRATELDLGVHLPAQIGLCPRPPAGDRDAARFLDRVEERLRDRLGIP